MISLDINLVKKFGLIEPKIEVLVKAQQGEKKEFVLKKADDLLDAIDKIVKKSNIKVTQFKTSIHCGLFQESLSCKIISTMISALSFLKTN